MAVSSFRLRILLRKIWKALNLNTRPRSSGLSALKSPHTLLSTKTNQQAEHAITEILDIFEALQKVQAANGLSPGDEVNALFGKLVGLCTESVSRSVMENVMNDSRILEILPSLRKLCAEGESLLETYSVKSIIGAARNIDPDSVFGRLRSFPYHQNYIELTRLELAALYAITPPEYIIRKIAFIGSGPLPLSTLCLRDILNSKDSPFEMPSVPMASLLDLDLDVDTDLDLKEGENGKCEDKYVTLMNIDRDAAALELSRKLCRALGVRGGGMEFWCTDLGNGEDGGDGGESKEEMEQRLREYDVVFLAALVGENQEQKEMMIEKVAGQMREGSILVVRSAEGMRALLYPEFDYTSKRVRAVLDVGIILHPQNQVVNSVIVGRVKECDLY